MIKFQCPNGHPLSTTDDRAGTAAKCPKCQMPLVVPNASTTNGTPPATGSGKQGSGKQADAAVKEAGDSKKVAAAMAAKSGPQPTLPADQIVFLCPNGHRLNGPARLKGKAGQCPHCGAKFRIPEDEEEDVEDFEELEEQHVAESMTEEEFAAEEVEEVDIEEITEYDESEDIDQLEPFQEAPPTVIDAFLAPIGDDIHPYAVIIAQLWIAKDPGQAIDLYLQKGDIFSPELFAESLSQPLFGIFGRREKEGGGHTLIVLPWENITRIEIRHVKQVPIGILR